jgi:hypothetical protein
MDNFAEMIDQLQRGEPTHGSDEIAAGLRLITNEFDLAWVVPPRGGSGRGSYSTISTPLFLLRDYKCKEGDCLLAILRNNLEDPEKIPALPRNNTLRKQLGLPQGPIPVNLLDLLEERFQIGLELYGEELRIERDFTDHDKNICDATWEYQKIRPAGAYPKTISIALTHNESHYSQIAKFNPISLCPITGDFPASTNIDTIRARVIAQGRPWLANPPEKKKRRVREREPIALDAGKKRGPKKEHWIVVFDFETVWDPDNLSRITPYAVGWLAFPADRTDADFTKDRDAVRIDPTFGRCQYKLLEFIRSCPSNRRYTLVGYNNSRFDNFLLAKAANNRDCLNNVFWANNSIMNMRIDRFHDTLDLCRLCPGMSLSMAANGFQTSPKKIEGFNHEEVQAAFLEGRLEEWRKENSAKESEYLMCDILSTASLFVKLTSTLKEISGVDPIKAATIGRLTWKSFIKSKPPIAPAKDEETDKFFRASIVGGRTQNFKEAGHTVSGKLRMIDVCSLYPTTLKGVNPHLFPPQCHYGYFPTGEYKKTPTYVPGKIGSYRVRVIRQPEKNILPRRSDKAGDPLDWKHEGEFETYTTSCSIELIRAYGGEVEVFEGYYWEESSNILFTGFIDRIFAIKQEQDRLKKIGSPDYNPALRECAKLLLNALTGKFAQRNFDDRVVFVRGAAAQLAEEAKMRNGPVMWIPMCGETGMLVGKKPLDEVYKADKAKPSQISALIYEYSRMYMYHLIIAHHDIMYMDTDSALLSEHDYNLFVKRHNELCFQELGRTKTLGDLEEELGYPEEAEAILLAPKLYFVGGCGKASKVKIKGVCRHRDRLANKELYERYKGASPRQLRELYVGDDLGHLKDEKDARLMFEQIRDEGEAYVLCSQLQKDKVDKAGKALGICQRYHFKRLTSSSKNYRG